MCTIIFTIITIFGFFRLNPYLSGKCNILDIQQFNKTTIIEYQYKNYPPKYKNYNYTAGSLDTVGCYYNVYDNSIYNIGEYTTTESTVFLYIFIFITCFIFVIEMKVYFDINV